MRVTLVIFVLIVSGFLGACATMSKDECLSSDWNLIGYEDGVVGLSATQLGAHRKACAEYGVVPDKEEYGTGYEEGLTAFCSFDKGAQHGRAGGTSRQICATKPDYQAGYKEGIGSYCSKEQGIQFGESGLDYQSVCPRDSDFQTGYLEGLNSYCTYNSGYNIGLSNQAIRNICPNQLKVEYQRGHQTGNQVRELENQKVALHQRANELEKAKQANGDQIHQAELELLDLPKTAYSQRKNLYEQMRILSNEGKQVSRSQSELRQELLSIDSEINRVSRSVIAVDTHQIEEREDVAVVLNKPYGLAGPDTPSGGRYSCHRLYSQDPKILNQITRYSTIPPDQMSISRAVGQQNASIEIKETHYNDPKFNQRICSLDRSQCRFENRWLILKVSGKEILLVNSEIQEVTFSNDTYTRVFAENISKTEAKICFIER